jgi:hypothetical protein
MAWVGGTMFGTDEGQVSLATSLSVRVSKLYVSNSDTLSIRDSNPYISPKVISFYVPL